MKDKNELRESHLRGFGGSDAAMFFKFGRYGLGRMNATDKRRILQVVRKDECKSGTLFMGNVYTDAGHEFEDWIANEQLEVGFERERVMTCPDKFSGLAFDIFAHADFVGEEDYVIECKYSKNRTEKVVATYRAQLQWYYMLGASKVTLCHGWGGVFPFVVDGFELVDVPYDEFVVDNIRRGICILDMAIKAGEFDWVDEEYLSVYVTELDEDTAYMVETLAEMTKQIKELETKSKDIREALAENMGSQGMTGIKGDGYTITYWPSTERRTFDVKKAQGKFAELKEDDYYKTTSVKETIKITIA